MDSLQFSIFSLGGSLKTIFLLGFKFSGEKAGAVDRFETDHGSLAFKVVVGSIEVHFFDFGLDLSQQIFELGTIINVIKG